LHILLITYSYYPALNPRAFRWTELAEYWTSTGDTVDVIAGWLPGAARVEECNRVRVYRVGGGLVERLRAGLTGKSSRAPVVANGGTRSLAASWVARAAGRIGTAAKWIHDRTWKKLYWPDYACLWYFPAVGQAERLLSERRYDALVTVSLPFTSHLVGRRIKRRSPGLTWLVDTGDPFCFLDATPHNNLRLYQRLNYRAERQVFNGCDAIAVTTEATRRIYQGLFPEAVGKIEVIPPLVPEEKQGDQEDVFADDGTLRLVFIGTLYRTIRDPGPLLAAFVRLLQTDLASRLELHFFGGTNDCETRFNPYAGLIGKKVFLHGTVPRARALAAMRQAATLINIGNETPYQLPSKLLEYMASGRPIINFVSGPDDSSLGVLEKYLRHLNVPKDASVERLATDMYEFLCGFASTGNVSNLAALESFRCPAIAGRYRALMHKRQ
jgi:glycosyltransferase involved in cell wall biosynthesis